MNDEQSLRRVEWGEVLPAVRLFSATRCAAAITPLAMGFVAIVLLYVGGRALDGIWLAAGGGLEAGPAERAVLSSQEIAELIRGRLDAEAGRPAEGAATPRRGPFQATLDMLQACLAGGVQGAAALRLGIAGGPYGPAPSLAGSALEAVRGLVLLAHQRPFFTLLFFLWANAVLALYGGGISRYVAIRVGLGEYVSFAEATHFAWQKWGQLFTATAALVGAGLAVALALILGGLIGAIPYVGELFLGLTFWLTIIGGMALAALFLALAAGFPLIWPAIAVEGSDAGDGLMRSGAYIRSRPWSAGLYALLALFGGAFALLVARGLAMLALKLTHTCARIGVGAFGAAHSSGDESLNKLDGIWVMPDWSELTLLPTVAGPSFWGAFGLGGELNWAATFAMWMVMLWVFGVVAVVGGYALSWYFAAATGAYLLLRWEVDRIHPGEVFYETLDDGFPADAGEVAEGGAAGQEAGDAESGDSAGAGDAD